MIPERKYHQSRKYMTYLCPSCGSIVGMKELKTGAFIYQEDKCKRGHAIDWGITIHEWQPTVTSYGEKATCGNCKKRDDCGKFGYVCGNWIEASIDDGYQMSMF